MTEITPLLCIEGPAAIFQVFDNRVVIAPKGLLGLITQGLTGGAKEIPYSSIQAIRFKTANFWVNGYLSFTIAGAREAQGIEELGQDPNTFFFKAAANSEAERAKVLIEEKLKLLNKSGRDGSSSATDELHKLLDLKKAGAITEQEFQTMKEKILKSA